MNGPNDATADMDGYALRCWNVDGHMQMTLIAPDGHVVLQMRPRNIEDGARAATAIVRIAAVVTGAVSLPEVRS